MKTEKIRKILGWCAIINLVIIVFMSFYIFFAEGIYEIHKLWFLRPIEDFITMIYATIIMYKLLWFVFNVVPYFAIRIVEKESAKAMLEE